MVIYRFALINRLLTEYPIKCILINIVDYIFMRPSDFISRVLLCLIKIILNVVVVYLRKTIYGKKVVSSLMEFATGTPIGINLSLTIVLLSGISQIYDSNGTRW